MIRSLGNRLRIIFSKREEQPAEVEDVAPPPRHRDVEFVAYAEDCLLSGRLAMDTSRLTDLLNSHDEYVLEDVLVERIGDGSSLELTEVLVSRDEIFLVHATGPRGDPGRRHRTRQHPIAMQLGPFQVRGYVHALPGSDPVQSLRRRKTMVPITDAWIEYRSGDAQHRSRVSTVVVNRELMDWVVEALDDEVEMPDLPLAVDAGPLVKDFTGNLFTQYREPPDAATR